MRALLFTILMFQFLRPAISRAVDISADPHFITWSASIEKYRKHFDLQNPDSKKVDNQGNGDDSLYGVRNFRSVLTGVYYRGGANNVYNRIEKRDNHNPLQPMALENLCKQNFGTALYFYKTNADKMQKETLCKTTEDKKPNTLTYEQKSALDEKVQLEILKLVYEHIKNLDTHPMYGHCWNGWHASGLMATLILRQFCNYSPEKALDYWMRNTDGNNKGFAKIKKRIKTFAPLPEYKIDAKVSELICPKKD